MRRKQPQGERAAVPIAIYRFPEADLPDPLVRLAAFLLDILLTFIGRPVATLTSVHVRSGWVAMMVEVDDASFDTARAVMDSYLARTAR